MLDSYIYHGFDRWEDIFRDYDSNYLEDKNKLLSRIITCC